MVSVVLYGALALVIAAAVVAVLVVVLPDDTVAALPRDVVPSGLPVGGPLGADDVARLRLPVGVRGYRMADTDAVLDRLASELERRDREIASLRLQHSQPAAELPAPELPAPELPAPELPAPQLPGPPEHAASTQAHGH